MQEIVFLQNVRSPHKQMPGSGGEHRDPGWLFPEVAIGRGHPAARLRG